MLSAGGIDLIKNGGYSFYMKEKIEVSLSCFVPTFVMEIQIPNDRDSEEYIDELLDSILDDEFKYNVEWDFI